MRAGSRVPIVCLSARGFFCPHEPRIHDRTQINSTRSNEAAECFWASLVAGRPNWRTDGHRSSVPLAESRYHRTERSHRPTCANRQVGRFASHASLTSLHSHWRHELTNPQHHNRRPVTTHDTRVVGTRLPYPSVVLCIAGRRHTNTIGAQSQQGQSCTRARKGVCRAPPETVAQAVSTTEEPQ
jgi:hypothetical protein